ncbi:MAG: hypothetical protein ACP5VS_17455, partial [Desulfomonilaceae bacterium]
HGNTWEVINMRRTVKYHIWPRDIRFEDGLEPLVEFVSERNFVIKDQKCCEFYIAISKFEELECDSIDQFVKKMKHTPEYELSRVLLLFNRSGLDDYLKIMIKFDWHTIDIWVGSTNPDLVDAIHVFLKEIFYLKNPEIPESPENRAKYLQPTIFIAHRFDASGKNYFESLSTFLKLLGFQVKHGKEYTSEGIPDKVRSRIDSQDIFIVTVSGPGEAPWLIAEPTYALGKGKHIVLAVENGANYDPTILGKDLEQIRFGSGHIEQTFIPLLQEFRSVRVKGL